MRVPPRCPLREAAQSIAATGAGISTPGRDREDPRRNVSIVALSATLIEVRESSISSSRPGWSAPPSPGRDCSPYIDVMAIRQTTRLELSPRQISQRLPSPLVPVLVSLRHQHSNFPGPLGGHLFMYDGCRPTFPLASPVFFLSLTCPWRFGAFSPSSLGRRLFRAEDGCTTHGSVQVRRDAPAPACAMPPRGCQVSFLPDDSVKHEAPSPRSKSLLLPPRRATTSVCLVSDGNSPSGRVVILRGTGQQVVCYGILTDAQDAVDTFRLTFWLFSDMVFCGTCHSLGGSAGGLSWLRERRDGRVSRFFLRPVYGREWPGGYLGGRGEMFVGGTEMG
jgi:hypothetical protein